VAAEHWAFDSSLLEDLAERRLELAMEGHRLFDLQRWGSFKDVLNDYIDIEKTRRPQLGNAVQVVDKHRWYPIPPDEIELSKVGDTPQLTQNPGW
jgi:hypothetical protein